MASTFKDLISMLEIPDLPFSEVSVHCFYGEQGNDVRQPSADVLRELIDSRYTAYDMLLTFCNFHEQWVTFAALEVYVRCAYRAYSLLSIDYEEGDGLDDRDAPHIVIWRFNLPQLLSPPTTPSLQASVSDLTYMINKHQKQPLRTGVIASFPNFAALTRGFDKVTSTLPPFDVQEYHEQYGANNQPPNVLDMALRIFKEIDDLLSLYPQYFTLHNMSSSWEEEQAICNVEPALTYQLELSRLSNYNLTPCFTESKQLHIYHAIMHEN
ncbi:uncharacterized protein LAESUDRAFT_758466 [Laetiporus sulphureus 93-53]|uniref:Acetyl-CoA carboxylase central domain-containing protein n=1 Tax=Laetiporus sulphureus 93-53 TaxID=1314785 RepID=A0A165ENW1_9APHY|nr:uncharacterized protein LAESUDRAFT_758466 [Laetiporus sulphureus 93-53]KZT07453.1 hypothetical protein LAESUDRAFT_758466 [Laetiporus sulphureus 93-53]